MTDQSRQANSIPHLYELRSAARVLIILAGSVGFYFLSRHDYPLFHSLSDILTTFIAAGVFIIIWNGRRLLDNHYYLFISIAFLFFAMFDILHLLGNKGMGVFPQYGNLGPAFYIIGRYILGISFLIAPLFIKRKLKPAIMFIVYSLISAVLILSVFYWKNFPITIIDNVGLTPFKIISDYAICLFFLAAIILLYLKRQAFDPRVLRMTLFSLIFFIATGLAFTLYTDPFGLTNAIGHFFQIASFYLIFQTFIETGLARPQNILFRSLQLSNNEIRKLNEELERVNTNLTQSLADLEKSDAALKESEAASRKTAANLEASNKELETFAYSVSHDLRAPLRSLDGFSQVILEDYSDKLDAAGRDYLARIRAATQHMAEITEGMLKLSRVVRSELSLEPFNLSQAASKIMLDLQEKEPGRHVELTIAPDLVAHGDASLLQTALYNILENAWKFTSKSPEPRIEFGTSMKGQTRIYFVKDNGVGFDMKYYDKLFQPYQRLHTDRDYPGTGIGLATVQRICRRHGGEVWADSTPGEGTTIFFTLG